MNKWVERVAELREQSRRQDLRILIWGPGEPSSSADGAAVVKHQKRIQIRDAISKAYQFAEVKFSEDADLADATAFVRGTLRKEAVHSYLANVVIMLDVSRGVDLELDHFVPNYPWFREKVYVLLPEKHKGTKGLVGDVLSNLRDDQIYWYTEKEFSECSLATKVCIEFVDTAALAIMLAPKS